MIKPISVLHDEWELLSTGTEQEVMDSAVRNLGAHLRYRENFHWAIIFGSLGWACALPFILWWFVFGGEQACR